MKIPLIDLAAQYHVIREEIDRVIHEVLERGTFILGPKVAAFEEAISSYLGVKHAVGVASGTDALLLTLRAYGIGQGDEVIVPAYTFFATAEAVSQSGATPVFVDIDFETYCIDAAGIESRITPQTKAIIPVHLYGHPVEMAPILELAKGRGLKVIEDTAQALGAEYKGRKTGSLGDVGCLSFFPSKNLGGCGDGGMVVTDDSSVADVVRKLRTHGWRTKYFPEMFGWNSRLDELQAAILRVKLNYLDRWNERRRWIAARYRQRLADTAVGLAWEAPYAKHVYHLFILRVNERKAVQDHLKSLGIASSIYYPLPLHQLEPYKHRGYGPGAFPEAERAARDTLAIPLYPEMTDDQIEVVASGVREALALVVSRL
ncbi:MAG: DegT/DnrJ/EryC1/StrS family aminotransferase [Candidatus Methylomirabilales bacterium]